MKQSIINGTYGSNKTPCHVFTCSIGDGATWYCVKGSGNVNATWQEIEDGQDVEALEDCDCFTTAPINLLNDLAEHVASHHFYLDCGDYEHYDEESAVSDMLNGNYSDPDDYYYPRIILESWVNGNRAQARKQFAEYGDAAAVMGFAEEMGVSPKDVATILNH